jgi:hypothetical protein
VPSSAKEWNESTLQPERLEYYQLDVTQDHGAGKLVCGGTER